MFVVKTVQIQINIEDTDLSVLFIIIGILDLLIKKNVPECKVTEIHVYIIYIYIKQ